MRIRTQLTISFLLFLLTLAATAASLTVTSWQVHQTREQERIANRIGRISQEMIYLGEDYMLYGEAPQLDRWRARYEQLSTETALLEPRGARQEEILRSIRADQQWLKEVFDGWIATHGKRGPDPDPAFLRVSWSRMILQGKALATDASRLVDSIRGDADRAKRTNMLFLYGMVGILVIQLVVNHFIIQRRTLKSIKALRDGTEVVGSGNFDFALQVTKDDEIGDLKRSFSRMAEKLKAATARKSDLEREIRERRRTEEELRRSRAELDRAQEVAQIGWWRIDASNRLIWSDESYRIFGIPAGTPVTYEKFLAAVHPEDRHAVEAQWRAGMAGLPYEIEHRILDADGRVKWVREKAYVEFDEAGRWAGGFGIAQDITARKQAEERERRAHEETTFANRILRVFAECEDDEIFDGVLALVQQRMASSYGVFGYLSEPGHLVCPTLSKMLDECEVEGKCIQYPPEKWKGLWARALADKRSYCTNEAPRVPAEHPFIHNNLAVPILFHGKAIGLLNLANKEGGFTEQDRKTMDHIAVRTAPVLYAWIQRKLREEDRRRADEELRRSEGRLKELLSEKEALLKEIHHRVKNNMQVISSLVDLQADEVRDPILREIFREVNYRVRSMAMVHEKLYQSPDLAHVEFGDYAESLLGYMWRAQGMSSSRIRLNLELERVFLPVNAAVPCGLILNELFSNALKHAFPGRDSGNVHVSLRGEAGGKVALCVRDDGVGLPPGMDWEKSHSLGLRIVKTLARQLHAAVEVRSGGGTGFALSFEPLEGRKNPATSDRAGQPLSRS